MKRCMASLESQTDGYSRFDLFTLPICITLIFNQFIQPDTIVPDGLEPADWNKYSYVGDNPINFVDPSGYCKGKATNQSNPDIGCWNEITFIQTIYSSIKISPNNWTTQEFSAVEKALRGMTHTLGGSEVFNFVYNRNITISRAGWFVSWITGSEEGSDAPGLGSVTIYDDAFKTNYDIGSAVVIHEFGHLLDARFGYLSKNSFREKF